jgi:hypothetical protein
VNDADPRSTRGIPNGTVNAISGRVVRSQSALESCREVASARVLRARSQPANVRGRTRLAFRSMEDTIDGAALDVLTAVRVSRDRIHLDGHLHHYRDDAAAPSLGARRSLPANATETPMGSVPDLKIAALAFLAVTSSRRVRATGLTRVRAGCWRSHCSPGHWCTFPTSSQLTALTPGSRLRRLRTRSSARSCGP